MKPWILVAALLQVAMVVAGHYNEFILLNLSAALGMGIPFVVAFLYGRTEGLGKSAAKSGTKSSTKSSTKSATKSAAWGGAVIGFIGAVMGIGLAIVLGDQALTLLTFGPASSAVTGALGSTIGFSTRSAKAASAPA